jgi:hypothetical protein
MSMDTTKAMITLPGMDTTKAMITPPGMDTTKAMITLPGMDTTKAMITPLNTITMHIKAVLIKGMIMDHKTTADIMR